MGEPMFDQPRRSSRQTYPCHFWVDKGGPAIYLQVFQVGTLHFQHEGRASN
jgi:hypothetical protein